MNYTIYLIKYIIFNLIILNYKKYYYLYFYKLHFFEQKIQLNIFP